MNENITELIKMILIGSGLQSIAKVCHFRQRKIKPIHCFKNILNSKNSQSKTGRIAFIR